MQRELLIVRHAKSAWDTGAPTDFERPLARRGEKAAPRVGRFLLREDLVPDYVVSSPAERAKQTVLAICRETGFDTASIRWDDDIYHGWTSSLLGALRKVPDSARRVLIAGHNPGLEDLLSTLSETRIEWPDDGKLLPTAAVAHLEINSPWSALSRSGGRLLSLTRARWLKDQGF